MTVQEERTQPLPEASSGTPIWAPEFVRPGQGIAAPEPMFTPPVTPSTGPGAPSAPQDDVRVSSTAPAVTPPTWSGKKTAIAAALAIGFASVGAVAATAVTAQTSQTDQAPGGQQGPGGQPGQGGQFRPGGGQQGQGGQLGPGGGQQGQGQQGGTGSSGTTGRTT